MKSLKPLFAWVMIAFAVCAFAFLPESSKAKVFNAESFTLENGLQVVVVTNNRAPVVTHMIWYKVGAADEQAGFSGMAHYLEHLLFKGTEKVAPGEFSRIVRQNGGNDNAFTSYDYTAYFQSIATEHLEKMMEMEADRMMNSNPPREHYASEKKVVLEERKQTTENDPRGLFSEQMRSQFFINHPYGTPVIGWMDEIKTYEWADVQKFYQKWYAPNNAIVVISGDVTLKDVKPLAEKTYGKLKRKELPDRTRPVLPPSDAPSETHKEHPSVHEPYFQKIFLGPSYAANRNKALALDVLQEIMSGGPTTRLYKKLVVDQKIAVSAGISFSGGMLDHGSIWTYGTPKGETTLKELESAIDHEIQNVIDNGVSEQEVSDAIQRLKDSAIYARDSLTGPAMIIGRSLTSGQTLEQIENWPEDISKVKAADIQAATAKYLDTKNPYHRAPVTGYLMPKKAKIENNKETAE